MKYIEKIKYGEIHFYYPFKLNNKNSYKQICENLAKTPLLFTDEFQEKIISHLGHSLEKDNIKKELESLDFFGKHCNVEINTYQDNRTLEDDNANIESDNLLLEVEGGESSVKFYLKNADLELLNRRNIRLQEEAKVSQKIYGYNFIDTQERFLLLPLEVELENGESTWLYPLLYLFSNKMGILKFELPLVNSNPEALFEDNYDKLLKKINNKWGIENYNSEKTLSSIKKFYLDNLFNNMETNVMLYPNDFKNIILVDFDGIPQSINSIPKEIQEDLFRIICAPVPTRKNTSFMKDAIEYLDNHSWGRHGIKYIARSTGGCLSLTDHTILNDYCDGKNVVNQTKIVTPFDDYYCFCNDVAGQICANVEFALLIIILKKTNESNDYFNKAKSIRKISDVQKEYNKNIIFISEMQENCYGSVSEQTAILEKMMPLYFKSEITEAKRQAVTNLIQQEEQEKNEKFQNYLSTGGLILTLMFGLPSLYESLTIIRNMFSCFEDNIPFFTLENTSVALWIILNGIIIFKLKKYRKT